MGLTLGEGVRRDSRVNIARSVGETPDSTGALWSSGRAQIAALQPASPPDSIAPCPTSKLERNVLVKFFAKKGQSSGNFNECAGAMSGASPLIHLERMPNSARRGDALDQQVCWPGKRASTPNKFSWR
jgi:hypothetical protein